MIVDKINKIVYTDPIVVTRVKQVQRDSPLEELRHDYYRKIPLKIHVLLYNERGKFVGTSESISTYA